MSPQFSMAENPKSGTATKSILGSLNVMPKYVSKNGKICVVKSKTKLKKGKKRWC